MNIVADEKKNTSSNKTETLGESIKEDNTLPTTVTDSIPVHEGNVLELENINTLTIDDQLNNSISKKPESKIVIQNSVQSPETPINNVFDTTNSE